MHYEWLCVSCVYKAEGAGMIAPALPETQGVCRDGPHYAKKTFSSSFIVIRCALSLKNHLNGCFAFMHICVSQCPWSPEVGITSTGAQFTEYISCGPWLVIKCRVNYKVLNKLGGVVYTFNPYRQVTEAGKSLDSRPALVYTVSETLTFFLKASVCLNEDFFFRYFAFQIVWF